jgi:hypothetical protein
MGSILFFTSHALADDVGANVEILQFGVALVVADDEGVLLDQILLLPFLSLSVFELLLHLLDQTECSAQVGAGGGNFTRLFLVRASIRAEI